MNTADSDATQEFTTAQVAAMLDLPLSRLRFWVRSGLVRPVREVNHTYLFSIDGVERLRYVAERRRAGAPIEQVRRELAAWSWNRPQPHPWPGPVDQPPAGEQVTGGAQPDGVETGRTRTPRFVVLANQKGGVGKTTSAINLGAALAELGHRTLIIDWDPQANASQALGLTHRELEQGPSVFDCVAGEREREREGERERLGLPVELPQVIRPTALRGLELAPANIQLSGLELELAHRLGREFTLRTICRRNALPYEVVIIDTPPTLGLITVNALVAGEVVVIPVQAEYLSLEGVRQLVHTITIVRDRLNPDLRIGAVLITMYDASTTPDPLAASIRRRIESVFGGRVLTEVIPRSPQVVAAQMQGVPLALFDPAGAATLAYRRIAEKLAKQLGLEVKGHAASAPREAPTR